MGNNYCMEVTLDINDGVIFGMFWMLRMVGYFEGNYL